MMHFMHRLLGSRSFRWHTALALIFTALLAVELVVLQSLKTTEHRLSDIFMRVQAPIYRADADIVVVDIDDASMAAMQDIAGLWAWPREIHADLLDALTEFKPRAVVFDVAFSERDMKRPKSDARLSEALGQHPHVYLPAIRHLKGQGSSDVSISSVASAFGIVAAGKSDAAAALQLPLAVEREHWQLGLINSMEDEDGVMRRYGLYANVGGWQLPSLPARVARDLGAQLPGGAQFLMRWPEAGHKRYPYSTLYRLLTEQRQALGEEELHVLDSLLRDKVIVIGASAAGSFDHHLTPLSAGYPGVDVLALAIDNLKNGHAIREASAFWPLILGTGLLAGMAVAFSRRVNPAVIGGVLLLASVAALAAADAALRQGFLVPVATPLMFAWAAFLLAAVAGYLRERRQREQAVSLFQRFLNPNVVKQIVEQGETVDSLSGRTRDITVLFSDIRGFTTLSESRPPQEVVTLLNRYFERQVDVVFRHGGTLDKFIGDCIMAFWGAPLDDPQHARHAVSAALEMEQVLLDFKRELQAEGSNVGDFDVGIGVHSGTAVVGFIGAQRKLDYTAIGDTVNLASRVEGLTKGITRVLVTQDTMRACQPASGIIFRPCGAFDVKGRAAQVELYEPGR